MSFDILNCDLRGVDTEHAISALQKYLETMETQMAEVHRLERVALDAERPRDADEADRQAFWDEQKALESLFGQDLIPAMRYSFVVLSHTVFETRLRAFCSDMQRDPQIRITVTDLGGSPIDRARTYLSKLAALKVADIPEWQQLRSFQRVRDCVVHAYGYVPELSGGKEKDIRELVRQNIGVTVDEQGRLALTKAYCGAHLSCLQSFFQSLFQAAGWR